GHGAAAAHRAGRWARRGRGARDARRYRSRAMSSVVRHAIDGFDWFVLVYFVLLNSGYLVLIAIASVDVARWMRRLSFAGHDDIFANPLTPGVSVLVPAFNEELSIVESARAMLAVKYPEFEVIIVDDGSTDATF